MERRDGRWRECDDLVTPCRGGRCVPPEYPMGSQAAQTDEGEYKKRPAGFRLALGGVLAFEVLFNSFLSSICAIFNMFFDFMVKAEAIKDRNSKNDCETNSDPNRNKKISYQPDEQSDSIKRT